MSLDIESEVSHISDKIYKFVNNKDYYQLIQSPWNYPFNLPYLPPHPFKYPMFDSHSENYSIESQFSQAKREQCYRKERWIYDRNIDKIREELVEEVYIIVRRFGIKNVEKYFLKYFPMKYTRNYLSGSCYDYSIPVNDPIRGINCPNYANSDYPLETNIQALEYLKILADSGIVIPVEVNEKIHELYWKYLNNIGIVENIYKGLKSRPNYDSNILNIINSYAYMGFNKSKQYNRSKSPKKSRKKSLYFFLTKLKIFKQ